MYYLHLVIISNILSCEDIIICDFIFKKLLISYLKNNNNHNNIINEISFMRI